MKYPRKRILLAIPAVTSYHTFLKDLVKELLATEWETHFASSLHAIPGFDCYEEAVAGFSHHISFPRGANPVRHFRAARELHKLVCQLSPDLVHCHFGATAFTGALARRSGWPVTISTIQGLTFPQSCGLKRAAFTACECWSHRRLDGTWVLSKCDQEALSRFGAAEKVHLQTSLGFGCRLNDFDPAKYSKEILDGLRQTLRISKEDFVFIFIGRQVHFKGFNIAARAFMNLARLGIRSVKFLLVGNRDPLHATGLAAHEETDFRSHPDVRQIGWVGDVSKYLAIADANVFPSVREGMPVNLMESLAMGVPVITSNSRGCRHVVQHEITGLLADPTVRSIESAMIRLFSDSNLRKELSVNALKQRLMFDRKNWVAEQISIYKSLIRATDSSERRNRLEYAPATVRT
jgi:glycosyltransferase involved in cell wall biosynthesis